MDNKNSGEGGWTLLTFMAGIVIGAAVALMLAPASGDETRKKLKKVAEKAGEYAAKKAREKLEEHAGDEEELNEEEKNES